MTSSEIQVRLAGTRDRRALPEIDPNVARDLDRRHAIDSAIAARHCWIADYAGQPAGYGLASRNFFSRDFIDLIYVAEFARRSGVGDAILAAIENACGAASIFTSTNESNAPMRALLKSRDYHPSGRIENLDPGDPELVYVKFLPENDKQTDYRGRGM
jgi:GNAT superfamily N-acetyltransferase